MQKPGARILIVEDEPLLQHLVKKQLKVLGYPAFDSAENGQLAVDMSGTTTYDAILMDVMMPGMDGIEATRLIREREKTTRARTAIIAMTGMADRSRCMDVGMDDFLQKPVTLAPLQNTLKKWLKHLATGETVVGLEAERRKRDAVLEETDKKLDDIQKRIAELRKRFGLES